MEWKYRQPVEIVFTHNAAEALSCEIAKAGWSKGILITSPSFVKRGIAEQFRQRCHGHIAAIYSAVTPNPEAAQCDAAAELARDAGAEFVAALGGGSVLDCAKVVAALALSGGTAPDYMATPASIGAKALPIIAIPTTAGTGSEVTSVAVISDHHKGLKKPLVADVFYPRTAIIDPTLTLGLPPHTTACTGFDALCHAVEAYWGRGHQPLCDIFAIEAARLVLDNIERAVSCGNDVAAREAMARAATTAGLAFALPKTSSCHACSYPLTNLLGIAHGEACALTLDWFIRFNADHGCGRTQQLATELGFADAYAFADAVADLKKRCGLRTTLADLNLSQEIIGRLEAESMHPNLKNNPVEVTPANLTALYSFLTTKGN